MVWGSAVPRPNYGLIISTSTPTKRRFAQVSHAYLIEQVHNNQVPQLLLKILILITQLRLIWTGAYKTMIAAHGNAMTDSNLFNLKLNGHDRLRLDRGYFTRSRAYGHTFRVLIIYL